MSQFLNYITKKQAGGDIGSLPGVLSLSNIQKEIKVQKEKRANKKGPTLSQYTPKAGDAERMLANREAYLAEQNKPLNRAARSQVATNAMNNIVEPMVNIEMGYAATQLVKPVLKNIGKTLTEETVLKNAYKINPYAEKLVNPNKSYRVAGLDARADFEAAGVLRAKTPKVPKDASLIERMMGNRPTGFPSFQKGYADMRYLPEEGGVVFETSLPTYKRGQINPVTGNQIKGRHYAHRVIHPEDGSVVSEIPGGYVKMYDGKPHWLKGYQELRNPAGSQETLRGHIDWADAVNYKKNPHFNPRLYENTVTDAYVAPTTDPALLPKLRNEFTKEEWKAMNRAERIRWRDRGGIDPKKQGGPIERPVFSFPARREVGQPIETSDYGDRFSFRETDDSEPNSMYWGYQGDERKGREVRDNGELRYGWNPGNNYDMYRTVTPYKTRRQIRKNTEVPESPEDVDFIANYRSASRNNHATSVPYEGEKHWNIPRLMVMPHMDVRSNEGMGLFSEGKQSARDYKNNITADAYKYFMLQNNGDKDAAWKQARKFVRKEVKPLLRGDVYQAAAEDGLNPYGAGSRLSAVDDTFYKDQEELKINQKNRDVAGSSEMEEEYLKRPMSDRQVDQYALDWLTKYKKMSRREAKDFIKTGKKEARAESLKLDEVYQQLRAEKLQSQKQGGPIVDPRGQWAHPGKDTIIPTKDGRITMQGVPYPVYGQDETGYGQMMMPGGEYSFPGKTIYEKPIDMFNYEMAYGGQMITRKDGSKSRRGLWDNIRANKGSGKKPTKEMLQQERKIRAAEAMYGMEVMAEGGAPSNPGFNALPEYVQAKILNNMAYGGMAYPFMADGGEANGEMAIGQMAAVSDKMAKLRQFVNPDQNLDPWIASKLAVMDHSADAISDYLMYGGDNAEEMEEMEQMRKGGYVVTRSRDRKGKTHKVTGPDGTVKYFGDSKLGQHPGDPKRKKAFYARHKKNLAGNPYFRAFARATWKQGGEINMMKGGGTFSGNAYYQQGGQPSVGSEMEVTPEQLEMLRAQGYEFEII